MDVDFTIKITKYLLNYVYSTSEFYLQQQKK